MDVLKYPLEPENRYILWNLLPSYIKDCGEIVDVKQIYDICTIEQEAKQ